MQEGIFSDEIMLDIEEVSRYIENTKRPCSLFTIVSLRFQGIRNKGQGFCAFPIVLFGQ